MQNPSHIFHPITEPYTVDHGYGPLRHYRNSYSETLPAPIAPAPVLQVFPLDLRSQIGRAHD